MSRFSRRQLMQLGGVLAGAAALGACDTRPSQVPTNDTRETGTLRWWDQFEPNAEFERELFAKFAKEPGGMPVDYTVYNPVKMGQALQLAQSSKQMPDVFTLVGVGLPPAALVAQGWFSPLQLDDAHKAMLPEGSLIEGKSVFDGKVYTFPIQSYRKHDTLNWFNRELFEKAGLEPENPPKTYDEFRAAARAIKKKGGENVSGWIAPIQLTGRLAGQIEQLAMAAGSPTVGGIDIRTGEYAYHTQPFIDAIEFWLALKKDGVLFPASSSLDARQARARWATGVAGMFFDGQYCIGVLVSSLKQFVDKVGVGPIVVPDASKPIVINTLPQVGGFWISAQSKYVEAASRLVSKFAEPEVQVGLASAMNAPPLKPEYLEKADVHPTFRTAVDLFNQHVFTAPDATVRNPAVADVVAEMKPSRPDFGEIIQGIMTGDITDWKAQLRKYSDSRSKERERAIGVATKKGSKVSLDDWRFPDWQPGTEFGPESYK
ncbi:MAG TPA: extracellular solute-binding protein [Actinopolymorphaceae bacterium]